jgi:hypothetical protein
MAPITARFYSNPIVNDFPNKYNYFTFKQFFPFFVSLIILRFLNFNSYFILIGSLIILFASIYYYKNEFNKKLDFLKELFYNGNEEDYDGRSYLSMDPNIIDFFYDNKFYINDNLTSYRKSLENANNLLRIRYEVDENLMREPEQLYRTSLMEKRESLNNFHSLVYKLVSHDVNNQIFYNNLERLKILLDKNINHIKYRLKQYNNNQINIWSIPNIDAIGDENDMDDKYYSKNFSFY